MGFEEFVQDLKEEMERIMPECEISFRDNTALNDINDPVLIIRPVGEMVAPCIHLNGYYGQYEQGGNISEIAERLKSTATEALADAPEIDFFNFAQAKSRLFIELVNKDMNDALLSRVVSRPEVGGLAGIVRCRTAGGEGSVLVTKELCRDRWCKTENEVYEIALKNTLKKEQYSMRTMKEVLREMADMDESDMQDIVLPDMYIISNQEREYGAAALLSKEVLEEAAAKLGGDFYIIPSSIHEIMAVPDDGEADPAVLEDMVYDVNRTQVLPEEVLSDHIMKYDAAKQIVQLVFGEELAESIAPQKCATHHR